MVYTVTADISANLKKLRRLEISGLIEIYQIKIEDPSPKTKKSLPTGVWGHTKWDKCVWADGEGARSFEQIKKIIGAHNVKDAMHLGDHIRDGRDYFVTEDRDILDHRDVLQKTFPGLEIRATDELVSEVTKKP